ncbi:peptidoglycan-binding domain-containing protein [Streptomyces sp. NPDC051987]|uniref:peptidoglycan-binding domain-containing protein n=1 Tax=Streptomyces sp. NPDC051987 TaxID=3155808 RepID=UPI0034415FDB
MGPQTGTEDGRLGTDSWMAARRMLNAWGYNAGTVDGIAGPQTRAASWNHNATGC